MEYPKPIFLQDLLPKIDQELITLLRGLTPEEWQLPTISPKWQIKDIAVHLLDGNLRTLSMLRDNYFGESPGEINTHQDMVAYLNRLNADWVQAMKRLSPQVLIDLLESSGKEYCDFISTLAPFEKATFSVGWAGEEESLNWFHVAREYTEKWHHQQQIRLAVGKEKKLYAKMFYLPCLETFMRALPYHYRNLIAQEGDTLKFQVRGEGGGTWYLQWKKEHWFLVSTPVEKIISETIIEQGIAWRVFTKGISKEEALKKSTILGEESYATEIFAMITIMG